MRFYKFYFTVLLASSSFASQFIDATTISNGILSTNAGDTIYLKGTANSECTVSNNLAFNGFTQVRNGSNSYKLTLSGILSGDELIKTGAGLVILSGNNTYGGGTTVEYGTLQAGSGDAFGSGPMLIGYDGTLDLNNNNVSCSGLGGSGNLLLGAGTLNISPANGQVFKFNGPIIGTGVLNQNGNGTLALQGDISGFTGSININSGFFEVNPSIPNLTLNNIFGTSNGIIVGGQLNKTGVNTLTLSGSISNLSSIYIASGILAFAFGGNNTTLSNSFSGSGTLSMTGKNTTILSGDLSGFTGSINMNSGTLAFDTSNKNITITSALTGNGGIISKIGPNNLTLKGGLSAFTGSFNIAQGGVVFSSDSAYSLTNTILGPGTIIKDGSGTLTFSASLSSFSGGITFNSASTLALDTSISSGATLKGPLAGPTSSSCIFSILGGDTLTISSSLSGFGGIFSIDNGTLAIDTTNTGNQTITNTIQGVGNFTKAGSNTLTLSGTSAYTGATTITGGTLQAGAANTFANSPLIVNTSGTTADFNDYAQTITDLSGYGTLRLGSGSVTLGSSNDSTFNGVISGTGTITKVGTGTLTLMGSGYTGTTTINNGAIQIANSSSLGTGQVTINGGALGAPNGVASIFMANPISFGSSGADFQNNSPLIMTGNISGNGNLTMDGTSLLSFSASNSYSGNTTVNNGILTNWCQQRPKHSKFRIFKCTKW